MVLFNSRIVRLALDLYCKNPKALDTMREFIVLPSNRLIRYVQTASVVLSLYIFVPQTLDMRGRPN